MSDRHPGSRHLQSRSIYLVSHVLIVLLMDIKKIQIPTVEAAVPVQPVV